MSESQVPMIVPLKLPSQNPQQLIERKSREAAWNQEIEGQYNTANEQTHLTSADLQGRC